MQEFERSRVELSSGQSVTITSWFDIDKNQWRGSAPALLHILASGSDGESSALTGATRDKAILAVRLALTKRLVVQDAR